MLFYFTALLEGICATFNLLIQALKQIRYVDTLEVPNAPSSTVGTMEPTQDTNMNVQPHSWPEAKPLPHLHIADSTQAAGTWVRAIAIESIRQWV